MLGWFTCKRRVLDEVFVLVESFWLFEKIKFSRKLSATAVRSSERSRRSIELVCWLRRSLRRNEDELLDVWAEVC